MRTPWQARRRVSLSFRPATHGPQAGRLTSTVSPGGGGPIQLAKVDLGGAGRGLPVVGVIGGPGLSAWRAPHEGPVLVRRARARRSDASAPRIGWAKQRRGMPTFLASSRRTRPSASWTEVERFRLITSSPCGLGRGRRAQQGGGRPRRRRSSSLTRASCAPSRPATAPRVIAPSTASDRRVIEHPWRESEDDRSRAVDDRARLDCLPRPGCG